MKAFYILKPDSIERKKVITEYKEIIKSQPFIINREQYLIKSWVELSSLLYDPIDKNLSLDELIKIRKQMLTTIKGYDYLFTDKPAIIDIFDIKNDIELLNILEKIKYQLRKKYVLNTPKNYFKFINLEEDILKEQLKKINISELDVSHIKVNYNENINIPNYNLAFLNCIHFPDPNIKSIERDMEIIESSKILTKKIKL